ncbi:MAG TPA: alpha/beta fold hydrolase [Steroidobacteraceae bacterium]|nr:alpha/beta fold hydrolase [Steroidobacteraceae bacterium]
MSEPLPIMLIPGLLLSPPLYAAQLPALWRLGPVTVATHHRDDSMAAIAQRILANAPPRFALVGLSMGGYISFEIMRQAPQRIARLALLDTMAVPDTPEVSSARRTQMALAEAGRLDQVVDNLWPRLVHPGRQGDRALRAIIDAMAADVGSQGYLHQQRANITRPDSRPTLATIRCPTLVLVGDQDGLTPPERAVEIANGIAGARLVRVADCGHLSTLERPDEVTQALHGWLSA